VSDDSSYEEECYECHSPCAEVRHREWLAVPGDGLNSVSTPGSTHSTDAMLRADPTAHRQQQQHQQTARDFLSICDRESNVPADVSSDLIQSTKAVNGKLRMLVELALAGHYDEPFKADAVAQIVNEWNAQYASDLVCKLDCLMYWFDQGYFSSDDRQVFAVHAWQLFNNDN
jgi:hypothetical protein